MLSTNALLQCVCCGRAKPMYDYAPMSNVCSTCAALPARDAANMARATAIAQINLERNTKDGRKLKRQEDKAAQYAVTGKKCGSCHSIKPAGAFAKCAPRTDGLQQDCEQCNNMKAALLRTGARLSDWHMVQAALRAQNDKLAAPVPITQPDNMTPSAGT